MQGEAFDTLCNSLLFGDYDRAERAFVARFTPTLWFDAREPFLPLAVGYTLFREDAPSPSADHTVRLSAYPGAVLAIEYAIWWDWDIGHLYELEHCWIYLDERHQPIACEVSGHGAFRQLLPADGLTFDGEHVQIYAEPGKHALAASPAGFEEARQPHPRGTTMELAGIQGLLVNSLFQDTLRSTPFADTLVRSYLARYAFEPSWCFEKRVTLAPEQHVPWPALREWVPRRVAWWLARLQYEIMPSDYRPIRVGRRAPPFSSVINSVEALQRAIAQGNDLIGVVLRICADGHVIVAPQAVMRDAQGVAWPIASSTLAELRALAPELQTFPTLMEAGALCLQGRVGLYAEIGDERIVRQVAPMLRDAPFAPFLFVATEHPNWLADFKAIAPKVRTVLQVSSQHIDAVALAEVAQADYLLCEQGLDTAQIEEAHRRGIGVIAGAAAPSNEAAPYDGVCNTIGLAAINEQRRIIALCIDSGDTLIDEGSEIKDAEEATQRASLIPGARELIDGLRKRGYPLALVVDGPAATFANTLGAYGLLDAFDAIAVSGQLGYSKPDPRIFHEALAQLGVHPSHCDRMLMLGNNLAVDIKGANQLGMISVWLDWAPRRSKIPADASETPRYTIRRPDELLALLDQLENG